MKVVMSHNLPNGQVVECIEIIGPKGENITISHWDDGDLRITVALKGNIRREGEYVRRTQEAAVCQRNELVSHAGAVHQLVFGKAQNTVKAPPARRSASHDFLHCEVL